VKYEDLNFAFLSKARILLPLPEWDKKDLDSFVKSIRSRHACEDGHPEPFKTT
jgi:hypothetical protein